MQLRILTLGCLLALTSGCSLVKLSDDVDQGQCRSHADCELLNDRKDARFDACELWQCSADKYCRLAPLDLDNDGFTPAVTVFAGEELVCEAKAARQDCDDGDDARRPGDDERCDERDNDCDSHVDEGVLESKSSVAVVFANAAAAGATDVAHAVDPVSGTVALAYSLTQDVKSVPGFTTLSSSLPSGASASTLSLPVGDTRVLLTKSVGVGALGADRFAVAFYDTSGRGRVLAGTVASVAGTTTLIAAESIIKYGLRCAPSEACAANASAPDDVIAAGPTGRPSLSAQRDDVLVGYVRGASEELCYAKDDSVATHPLLLNLLEVDGDELIERSTEALLLAQSSLTDAPALLAIPALPAGSAPLAFGWLVAYVDEAGAIVLRRVRVDGGELVASDPLLMLQDDGARYSGVSLALGPSNEGGQEVGLIAQRDCGVNARVVTAMLRASLDASGAPSVVRRKGPTEVGGAASESRGTLVYSRDRESWGAIYRDPKGVRARVLSAAGEPLGGAPYLLIENASSGETPLRVAHAPAALVRRGDAQWFGAVSYADREGQTPAHVFQAATLDSCSSK